jgi:hypothetical protein
MNATPSHRNARGSGGFTLIELIVVLGILVGFLAMLIQFVDSGVRLFDEGEAGQGLADRAEAARTAVERELRPLLADCRRIDPGVPRDRLLVQQLPLGLPPVVKPSDARAFVLRGAVSLAPEVEAMMQHEQLLLRAAQELGQSATPREIELRAGELRASSGLRGRGRLLLVQWPETEDGALLELRRGLFLEDERIAMGQDRSVDPFEVPVLGSPELPSLVLHAHTELLVGGLLHAEVLMWSQTTAGWEQSGNAGPEVVWDSARAGWLSDAALGPVFRLDRGPQSLDDPTDDVHPRALRVTLVVGQDERRRKEGLLDGAIDADSRTLRLVDGETFPGDAGGGWVKVEGEWVRYGSRVGDELRALQRGQRGTRAASHGGGAVLRVGRTVQFTIALPHGKDDWNG